MPSPLLRRVLPLAAVALIPAACSPDSTSSPLAPEATPVAAAARSADRCVNVDLELTASLGLWMFQGQVVGGGVPAPVTLGGIDGWLASFLENPGAPPQGRSGTTRWELTHVFFTSPPGAVDISGGGGFFVPAVDLGAQADWFLTDDRAVCADAGGGPFVCRVNDQMPLVDGAGMFAGAEGFLHNHGTITILDPNTGAGVGDFHVRGRVCGDGV